MAARTRPILAPLLLLPMLATCQAPMGEGPQMAAVPMINPLPIPDAPTPRPPRDRTEPAAITLLPDDDALAGAICRDQGALLPPSGTLFGHVRMDETPPAALVAPPERLRAAACQTVHRDMAGPLAALVAAAIAEDPPVGLAIAAISCHRSIARQTALFCADGRVATRGYAGQARWIAPPGYSEHATGFSIDFGSRSEGDCDLRPCFAETAVGRWLADNASRFGFELSFPQANPQGVSFEPWHYRYVASPAAQAVFARARRQTDDPVATRLSSADQ